RLASHRRIILSQLTVERVGQIRAELLLQLWKQRATVSPIAHFDHTQNHRVRFWIVSDYVNDLGVLDWHSRLTPRLSYSRHPKASGLSATQMATASSRRLVRGRLHLVIFVLLLRSFSLRVLRIKAYINIRAAIH